MAWMKYQCVVVISCNFSIAMFIYDCFPLLLVQINKNNQRKLWFLAEVIQKFFVLRAAHTILIQKVGTFRFVRFFFLLLQLKIHIELLFSRIVIFIWFDWNWKRVVCYSIIAKYILKMLIWLLQGINQVIEWEMQMLFFFGIVNVSISILFTFHLIFFEFLWIIRMIYCMTRYERFVRWKKKRKRNTIKLIVGRIFDGNDDIHNEAPLLLVDHSSSFPFFLVHLVAFMLRCTLLFRTPKNCRWDLYHFYFPLNNMWRRLAVVTIYMAV